VGVYHTGEGFLVNHINEQSQSQCHQHTNKGIDNRNAARFFQNARFEDIFKICDIFWAIVVGILCGAGFIALAVTGSLLIGLVLFFFVNKIKIENPYLLVIRYNENSIENSLEHVISGHAKKHSLKSKSVMPGNDFEVTYEIRVKENDMSFINNISAIEGVKSAIMLSYDGNFTA
jgi:hypothetical protein